MNKVAIIGIASRFPGAPDSRTFWENLCLGKESITRFTEQELLESGISEKEIKDPDYVPVKPVLDNIRDFDASFFGFSPMEANICDPQQRVFFECVWNAIEDAGYHIDSLTGRMGVFAGTTMSSYLINNLLKNRKIRESHDMIQLLINNDKDHLATKVSYKFNFTGPSVNLNTACSTSLVAAEHAVRSLIGYQCDMALAGGVSITVPEKEGYLFREGGIVSPDGHCRAFDAEGRGTVFGHGAGVVLLKRLDDALEDGDHIYAVITGAAINNDGSAKAGYTAPSVGGQAEVIAEALAMADIEPETIGYVEAHGTATQLGDPVEIRALQRAYEELNGKFNKKIPIGSVKSNIGHLDAAAGVAGLIKTALMLKHQKLVPTLHFKKFNREIEQMNPPFYVQTHLESWGDQQTPIRRAAVSSFGVGGTNAHLILEEAPARIQESKKTEGLDHIIVLTAITRKSLTDSITALDHYLDKHPDTNLEDLSGTLFFGRKHHEFRFTCFASSISELKKKLKAGLQSEKIFIQSADSRKIAFLFPGQGAQFIGMGAAYYDSEPEYRAILDEGFSLLKEEFNIDLTSYGLRPQDSVGLNINNGSFSATEMVQPAVYLVEIALARVLSNKGIHPDFIAGHSLGEWSAAVVAGICDWKDGLRIVAKRGEVIAAMEPGAMVAVSLNEEETKRYLNDDLAIASINTSDRLTISGSFDAIETLESNLDSGQIPYTRLQTSHAFHSAMMSEAANQFQEYLSQVNLQPPKIPIYSNVTGKLLTHEEACSPNYWADHILKPVRLADILHSLLNDHNCAIIEAGPGQSLSGFAMQSESWSDDRHITFRTMGKKGLESESLIEPGQLLSNLWACGALSSENLGIRHDQFNRISLPGYQFDRKTYWIEPDAKESLHGQIGKIANGSPKTGLSKPAHTETIPRSEFIREKLIHEFSEKSGHSPESLPTDAGFTELGLDSLSLVQVNRMLKETFNVKIPFRRLLQELSSIDKLAEWLDEHAVIQQHSGDSDLTEPKTETVDTEAHGEAKFSGGFGPYKKISQHASTEWTDKHQTFLEKLQKEYIKRTASSREYAIKHRPHLADARMVTGYQQQWKNLVYPIIIDHAEGSIAKDIDGNEYIDLVSGFGVNLLGHSPDLLTQSLHREIDKKRMLVAPQHELVGEAAKLLTEITGFDRACFCNTGSEAVMTAMRLARLVTGRKKIALFAGSYHGNFDNVLARKLYPREVSQAVPVVEGITSGSVEDLVILEYGSEYSLKWLEDHVDELAAIMVEPVQTRKPGLQPRSFLQAIRQMTQDRDTAFIIDEVVCGFRIDQKGARGFYEVECDISTYGKVIGSGLPIGAVAGSKQYMDGLDGGDWSFDDDSFPEADQTFFAGTFTKHPYTLSVLIETLNYLKDKGPKLQQGLNEKGDLLAKTVNEKLQALKAPVSLENCGSILHFTPQNGFPWLDLFFYQMVLEGVYVWGQRPYYLTLSHTKDQIQSIADAAGRAAKRLFEAGIFDDIQIGSGEEKPLDIIEVPLTEEQHEIWLASSFGEDAVRAYNSVSLLKITGALDHKMFLDAVQDTLTRHESLRATVSDDGSTLRIFAELQPLIEYDELNFQSNEQQKEAWINRLKQKEHERPFDLIQGPLTRFGLYKTGPDEHIFKFTYHHIICDGWSFDIIIQDILSIYSAKITGEEPDLLPAGRYSEYALNSRSEPSRDKDLKYWTEQFSDELPVLELPVDQKRSNERTFRAGTSRRKIPGSLYKKIRKTSSGYDSSLFHFTYAAFVLLLNKLSGQNDIVLGISYAGQQSLDNDRLVGHCVELLPVYNKLKPDQTFTEFLSATSSELYDAIEHHHCTYGALLKALKPKRDGSRIPLVSAIFNIDRMEETLQMGALTFEGIDVDKHYSAFEIALDIQDTGDSLNIQCYFNSDLYDQKSIDNWLRYYENLLHRLCSDHEAGTSIGRYSLEPNLTDSSYIRSLYNDDPKLPGTASIITLFEKQVLSEPDAIALISNSEKLTYHQFNQKVNQFAHSLINHGVGAETVVGICMKRSIDRMIAIFGVLKAGGAYMPIDPGHPPFRVQQMLEDANPIMIITSSESDNPVSNSGYKLLYTDQEKEHLRDLSPDNPEVKIEPNQLAYVIFTSGSTGKPKGVMIEHQSLVNRILWMQKEYPLTPSDRLIQKTPYTFDVSVWELFWWSITGSSLFLTEHGEEKFPELLEKSINTFAVTHIHFVPTMLDSFLDYLRHKGDQNAKYIPSVTTLFASGEALTHKHVEGVNELLLCNIHNLYGPTEATVDVSYFDCSDAHLYRSIPIGKPISNTALLILNESLQLQPAGVPGELYIGGIGVGRGYMNRPDLTEERFIENPFKEFSFKKLYKTGDKAVLLEDGQIVYLGRIDFQLKIRGNRIEAGEVAISLSEHPDISEAIVGDSSAYEQDIRLIAWFTWKDKKPDTHTLRNWLSDRLPAYMVPALFIPVDQWPLTSSGKLDRKKLPWKPDSQETGEISEPDTEIEKTVAEIWEKVLGHEPIGLDDDFFALGGDSILSIRIVNQLRQKGFNLTPRQLFRTPTIRALAELLSENETVMPADSEPTALDKWLPVQKWFLDLNLENPDYFHQSMWFKVEEQISVIEIEHAFKILAKTHPAFRTRVNGQGLPVELSPDQTEKIFLLENRDFSGKTDWKKVLEAEIDSIQKSLSIKNGPLIGILRIDTPDGLYLFISAHHLMIDGVSWRILIDDLQYIMDNRSTDPLSGTSTPGAWVRYLEQLSDQIEPEVLAAFFDHTSSEHISIPEDKSDQDNLGKFETFTEFRPGRQISEDLIHNLSPQGGAELNNWILTATGKAFCRWAGLNNIMIDVENNGRNAGHDQPDISRTIGWFTSIYPVAIDMEMDPPELSSRLDSLKFGGLEYGIACYLARNLYPGLPVKQASILYNYLGKTGRDELSNDLFTWADLPGGRSTAPENRRSHLFEVEAGIVDGQILIRITYSSEMWSKDEVDQLKSFIESELGIIARLSSVWSSGSGPESDSDLSSSDQLFNPEIDLSNLDFQ